MTVLKSQEVLGSSQNDTLKKAHGNCAHMCIYRYMHRCISVQLVIHSSKSILCVVLPDTVVDARVTVGSTTDKYLS